MGLLILWKKLPKQLEILERYVESNNLLLYLLSIDITEKTVR